jgi:hypothetical protein
MVGEDGWGGVNLAWSGNLAAEAPVSGVKGEPPRPKEWLVFATGIEALFVRGLKGRVTPELNRGPRPTPLYLLNADLTSWRIGPGRQKLGWMAR